MSTTALIPFHDGLPCRCEVYGHNLRATGRPGQWRCVNCKATGYCPGCVLVMPANVRLISCELHSVKGGSHDHE